MPEQKVKVIFRDSERRPVALHVATAHTLFEACRQALATFRAADWMGPRPTDETILECQVVGGAELWHVIAGDVPAPDPTRRTRQGESVPVNPGMRMRHVEPEQQNEMFPPDPRRALD